MRTPAQAFPVGEYIRDEMTARGLDERALAHRLLIPQEVLQGVLAGTCDLTLGVAYELALEFGTSVQSWLNIQNEYRNWCRSNKRPNELDRMETTA